MKVNDSQHPAARITHLEWDSTHFGFSVAQIEARVLCSVELSATLKRASAAGHRLVYWRTNIARPLPEEFLELHNGLLVDNKATYEAALPINGPIPSSDTAEQIQIREVSAGDPCIQLQRLAIHAGRFSRFHVDPRFPKPIFERLYQTWLARSIRHEIADVVFAAYGATHVPAGFVTVRADAGVGTIGLIAVAPSLRRRGIGSRLLDTAHRWMREHRLVRSRVVTQGANEAACRLYRRMGYQLAGVEFVYHFWLNEHPDCGDTL